MKKYLRAVALFLSLLSVLSLTGLSFAEEEIVLRVCNWEEYIDEGGWGEDEVIDLESGDIFGENHMVKDFETWYYETYGKRVRVEYSTSAPTKISIICLLSETYTISSVRPSI